MAQMMNIPKNAAGVFDVFRAHPRNKILHENQWKKVSVTHLYSPNYFYFRLVSEKSKLAAMLEQLRVFYTSPEGDALRTPDDLPMGLPVAVVSEGAWHRGRLTSDARRKKGRMAAEVKFQDIGEIKFCPIENIRFLHRMFIKIPTFAHCASLMNIRSVDATWEAAVNKKVRKKLMNSSSLLATTTGYFFHAATWGVEILDEDDGDKDMAAWMVEKFLALRMRW